jgi:hypothetical protein
MPYNQLTNLDYFEIRNSLRDYLRANSDFTDYDFEGSVFSTLLDLLAYNTYYTAFNTNMVANEVFLETATLRDNVVSIAKQLGYVPRSAKAPEADVTCSLTLSSTAMPNAIVFKRGSGFITTFDNAIYQYVLLDDAKAIVNGGVATFNNLKVYEGTIVTSFVNVTNDSPSFTITNSGVDVSTIRVKVYDSPTSSSFQIYSYAENILTTTPSSRVYFVSEVEDENYKVTFGDGILGYKIPAGSRIEISYLATSGEITNSAKTFTYAGVLEDENGNIPFSVATIQINTNAQSFGGAPIESIDKIKKNAPAMFGAQNRAVTSDDYGAIVRRIYPSVADIYSFGGEFANPPEYGKVKIVIKPSDAAFLTSFTKNRIVEEIRKFSIASVTPEIIDPSILYIELNSKIYYQRTATNKTPSAIRSDVIRNIENYIANSDTEKFGGKFRYSKFTGAIDSSEISIKSNLTTIVMRKDFYPSLNNSTYYELCFNNPFDYDNDELALSSTGFVVQEYPNFTCYLEDKDGKVVLYRLDSQTGDKIVLNQNQGEINYSTGEIKLYNLTIIKGSFNDEKIEVRLRPQYNDIVAKREMFLDVDISKSSFTIIQE